MELKHVARAHLPSRVVRWFAPALIAVLVAVSFAPIVNNEFVNWDDPSYFLDNPHYRGLSSTHLAWMFTTLDFSHYQPITWLSHALVYTWWGMDPRGYHLGNLLLHSANAILCYFFILVLLRIVRATPHPLGVAVAATVGALIFALHPLRVEAVAWATERQEVLAAFFVLLALISYLRLQEQHAGAGPGRWYVLSVACLALSLLSKAAGMMLPLVLLALDVYPLQRFTGANRAARLRVVAEKVPYALAALGAALLAFHAKQSFFMRPMAQHGIPERIMQSTYGLCFYIWKTLLPVRLSPLYLLERPLHPSDPIYLACTVVVIGVTAVLVILRHRWPWAILAWACYVIILFPVLGMTQSGPQKVADRYTYLGCLPWAVLVAVGVQQMWRRVERGSLSKRVAYGVGAAIVIALALLGTLTAAQTRVWHDSVSLWGRAIAVEPDNYIAYNNRGTGRRLKGDVIGGRADFEQAVRLRPLYWEARVNRAWARRVTGDLDGAIGDYTDLIRRDPRYAYAYNGRGLARQAKGDLDGAVADHGKAVAFAPPGSSERREFERSLDAARQQLVAQRPPS